jgi:hypothetical protein
MVAGGKWRMGPRRPDQVVLNWRGLATSLSTPVTALRQFRRVDPEVLATDPFVLICVSAVLGWPPSRSYHGTAYFAPRSWFNFEQPLLGRFSTVCSRWGA